MRALTEAGVRIPADMAVLGYDDMDIAQYVYPALTTIRQPFEEMGRTAVECLLGTMDKSRRDTENIVVKPELVVRKSA